MQPNNRSNGPVMDIQRPSSTQPSTPPRPVVSQESLSTSSQLGRPATMEYTRPRPGVPNQPSRFDSSADQAKVQEMAKSTDQPKPKKSKKGLIIGIALFLILALGGGGAAYYFLVLNKDQPAAVEQQPAPTVEPEEDSAIQATPEGVDNATNTIDQSLNSLDDNADFRTDELTDDALGI